MSRQYSDLALAEFWRTHGADIMRTWRYGSHWRTVPLLPPEPETQPTRRDIARAIGQPVAVRIRVEGGELLWQGSEKQ